MGMATVKLQYTAVDALYFTVKYLQYIIVKHVQYITVIFTINYCKITVKVMQLVASNLL